MKFFFFFFFSSCFAYAQYAPAAGQPGTSAMSKDSSVFVDWAAGSVVERGWQDISDTSLGYASAGDSSSVIGIAGINGVVSLGDGGNAIVTFFHPIVNGPSWDFAVFENSFSDTFLELAFVEVSSDGINFYRFPASSLTDTTVQTGPFDLTDPAKINNLAGKYRALYGTPFDLNELSGITGLDINKIQYVKIVDVVGSIQPQYAGYDTAGRAVNDPWPTGFGSSGFDLDAIGVIHENTAAAISEKDFSRDLELYPNPCSRFQMLAATAKNNVPLKEITIFSITGQTVLNFKRDEFFKINVSSLSSGIYVLQAVTADNKTIRKKLMIQ